MDKTKEEIIKEALDKHYQHNHNIEKLFGEVWDIAKKAGFESCREKVEEGVKKGAIESEMPINAYRSVLTTIREVKQ